MLNARRNSVHKKNNSERSRNPVRTLGLLFRRAKSPSTDYRGSLSPKLCIHLFLSTLFHYAQVACDEDVSTYVIDAVNDLIANLVHKQEKSMSVTERSRDIGVSDRKSVLRLMSSTHLPAPTGRQPYHDRVPHTADRLPNQISDDSHAKGES